MIYIPELTIVVIDCYNYGKAVAALQKCNLQVKAARVVLLTDIEIQLDGIEVIQIPTISSKEEYSHFCIKELYKHFDTSHCLVVQWDGYILDGSVWDEKWLQYDYIGAPWLYVDGRNVGNGGFSLRSKHLQEVLGTDEKIEITSPEDEVIGRLYRDYLIETHGIKYPSEDIADLFSFELREPKAVTFGFHSYFHQPYKPTIVFKRSGALGDILIAEPLFRYYALKGYNIVLDIPLSMYDLFPNHYFPIKHISQFDKGRIKPEREVNLDLAYEVKPRQNYLKSYFEFCGIKDYTLTRPQLYPLVDERTKLFKKYAVLHIDIRETPHRNIYGVDWRQIVRHLENRGYIVLQIGQGSHESVSMEINTASIAFLKFVIAGCDLMVCVDSAPAGIGVAYNKPTVICFGSVNCHYVHPDLTNVEIVQGKCEKSGCWHVEGGTSGVPCAFVNTEKYLQCCKSDADIIIDAIDRLVNK